AEGPDPIELEVPRWGGARDEGRGARGKGRGERGKGRGVRDEGRGKDWERSGDYFPEKPWRLRAFA
ncbi:MAG: hypothetical protein ACOYLF_15725, partial [Blastocatellia bacterium]